MAVRLNHTIVAARDPVASAQFLGDVLGIPVGERVSHFTPLRLGNGVTLDYDRADVVHRQHYAFLVDDDDFDRAFAVIRERGVTYWADPGHSREGEINRRGGGRGLYFSDPDGHNMEILTRG